MFPRAVGSINFPATQFFFCFVFSVNIVDPSKDAPFKVAPSKWEAVDEAELESQGEAFESVRLVVTYIMLS